MAKSYRRLNLFMAKPLGDGQMFADLLAGAPVDTYPMADNLGIDGVLYVRQSAEKRPSWGSMLDEVAGRV
ncbi:hypothetical protein, partial [Burkholderia sp. GbtcB21]|uniref:hypothetical protein n=1 Tax=Burkholderia sp. GbtcB21 TaxID=2824766 RepID=UPI001C30F171